MKSEGRAGLELPRNPSYASGDSCMCLPIAVCTWAERWIRYRASGDDTSMGPPLVLPHGSCFDARLPRCTHRKCPCFLLVAMLLQCYALPLYPRQSNGLALVAVANVNALQLPLPPEPSWSVSPVF